MKRIVLVLLLLFFLGSCTMQNSINVEENNKSNLSVATFAGGCFWCSEADFEKIPGVKEVISGYSGGEEINPTYGEVASGSTTHREAIQVFYDSKDVSYEKLLEVFWRHHDPTDSGGSFVDRGFQYSSAIFYHNEEQKELAENSLKKLNSTGKFKGPIVSAIIPFKNFYPAEEYHQDYYKKNPVKYKYYRSGSGRDDYIEEYWKN